MASGSLYKNVLDNRRSRKWSNSEQIGRVLWALAWPLFRLSPRPLWFWRRNLLRIFGAKIGSGVHVFPTVRISIPWNLCLGDYAGIGDRVILYALGPISIGARATVSQGAHLCAGSHDWRERDMPLTKPSIMIEDDCWIAADAFVGPGVKIGARAILGARAVALRDIPTEAIAIGNPAVIVSTRNRHAKP